MIANFDNNAPKRKLAISGFDDEARRLLYIAANDGVHVDAFVSDNRQYHGLKFLNKPVMAPNELDDDWLLLTPWSRRNETPSHCDARCLPTERALADAGLIIYGTAVLGKEAFEQCAKLGLKVAAFCDSNAQMRGKTLNDCPILSPADLAEQFDRNTVVVIASQFRVEMEETLRQHGFTHVWHYLPDSTTRNDWLIRNQAAHKRLCLWGGNAHELDLIARRLAMWDVPVEFGVVERIPGDPRQDRYNVGLPIRGKQALATDVPTKVLLLRGCPTPEECFRGNELPNADYSYFETPNATLLGRCSRLDPSLGYVMLTDRTNDLGLQILKSSGTAPPIKLAILGDSTAQVGDMSAPAFPEMLVGIARSERRALEILSAANDGHIVSQSLIRLVRDLIPLRPDVVATYNLPNNERVFTAAKSQFLHKLQEEFYSRPAVNNERPVYYGTTPRDDHALMAHWLDTQRMMCAICHEFGIRFYAFIQADRRGTMTQGDQEWWMHGRGAVWGDKQFPTLPSPPDKTFIAPLIEASRHCEWLIDASDWLVGVPDAYVDGIHTTERGSRIVAEHIYDTIFREGR